MTEPTEPEVELKRDGRVRKAIVSRDSYAECTVCDAAWENVSAIASGTSHTMGTGHPVRCTYNAEYLYTKNTNKADHLPYGRAKKRAREEAAAAALAEAEGNGQGSA